MNFLSANIGLGGIKRNLGGEIITYEDLTVTLTDFDSNVHPVQLVGIYRVFPDNLSHYSVNSQYREDQYYFDLVTHDGAVWLGLLLPNPQSGETPLALGLATISVSGPLTQTDKPQDGQYDSFPIEIIAGVGSGAGGNAANQLKAYAPTKHFTVKPNTTFSGPVSGLQLEIDFDASVMTGHPIALRAVTLNRDPNSHLIQTVTDNGDDTMTLTAMLTNPEGFVSLESWTQGQSTYFDLELGLVSYGGGVALALEEEVLTDYFTVTGNSFYVDMNGDVISGVDPVLAR